MEQRSTSELGVVVENLQYSRGYDFLAQGDDESASPSACKKGFLKSPTWTYKWLGAKCQDFSLTVWNATPAPQEGRESTFWEIRCQLAIWNVSNGDTVRPWGYTNGTYTVRAYSGRNYYWYAQEDT